MATNKPRTILYRRRMEQRTDYKNRLKLLQSKKPRLVLRLTNQKVIAQIVTFELLGDKVGMGVDSGNLREMGWNYSGKNFPAAYLTGLLLAKRAVKKGYTEAVLDLGLSAKPKKSRAYAFLKGALDGGLKIPHGENKDIFPSEDLINGKHIAAYASQLKGKKEYEQQFGKCLKNKAVPEQICESFKQVKQKILSA